MAKVHKSQNLFSLKCALFNQLKRHDYFTYQHLSCVYYMHLYWQVLGESCDVIHLIFLVTQLQEKLHDFVLGLTHQLESLHSHLTQF